MDFYKQHYLSAIKTKRIERFAVFALTGKAEQDDHCANIYHKSLLYPVSHAFEEFLRQPSFLRNAKPSMKPNGEPLLGMQNLVLSPDAEEEGTPGAARATAHGGFDDDQATLKATLARILSVRETDAEFGAGRLRSASTNASRRAVLMGASRTQTIL